MIEEGVIRYAKKGPYCQDIRYRIVETTPTYLILATSTTLAGKATYDFQYLRINLGPSNIRLGYCGSRWADDPGDRFYLGDGIFTMSDADLKALWDGYVPCNPRHLPPGRQPFYDNWGSSVLFLESTGPYDTPLARQRRSDGIAPHSPSSRP